jgi:uncharacterized protein (TIGR02186 family)
VSARPAAAILLALLALAGVAVSGAARAEELVTSISTHRVAITSKFSGADLVVFGVIGRDRNTVPRAGPYDVVVVVRGPRANLVVRRKEAIGPVWTNRDQRRYAEAPAFLAFVSTRPLEEVAAPNVRQRLGLGLVDGVRRSFSAGPEDPYEMEFRQALARLQGDRDLFVEVERGVTFLTPEFFRAPVVLPAAAPVGGYEVETILFADGVAIARQATNFELTKAGFDLAIASASVDHSLLYGFVTAAMAVLFGWLANLIFRRD